MIPRAQSYWIVNSDATRVWSLPDGGFVPAADQNYQTWLQADPDNKPTRIESLVSLAGVLAGQGAAYPSDAAVTDAMKTAQATTLAQQLVFRMLFNHENRLRALERAAGLNGSPANITPAQAVAAVKALL